jgi:hypothetical protein
MAEDEFGTEGFEEKGFIRLLRTLLPRILKAVLWTAFYLLLDFLLHRSLPYETLPQGFRIATEGFILILLFFAVMGSLSSGTIFEYIFGFARGLSLIVFTWLVLNGGILTFSFPSEIGGNIALTLDFQIFLAMYVLTELLGVARNILRAMEFLSKKTEAPSRL